MIGLALLLAAAPIAALRPPVALAGPAEDVLGQTPDTTTTPDSGDDDDDDWQDDNNNDNNTGQPPTTFQPVPETDKGTVAEPDSTLKAKAAQHPAGQLDTLGVRPSGVAAKRLGAPAQRKPFFGIHPAIFFLGLVVGHIFVVRAVD